MLIYDGEIPDDGMHIAHMNGIPDMITRCNGLYEFREEGMWHRQIAYRENFPFQFCPAGNGRLCDESSGDGQGQAWVPQPAGLTSMNVHAG